MKGTLVCLATLLSLAGCAVGPDYRRPSTEGAQQFKEAAGWKVASPSDHVPRGEWWRVYEDPALDALMSQVAVSNQNVRQAEAQFRSARAAVQSARAPFFPSIDANGSATRGRGSRSRFSTITTPSTGSGGTVTSGTTSTTLSNSVENSYSASLDASWELDLWGRIRRQVENAKANAAASDADLEGASLSARAELAQDYFQLRITDAQIKLLNDEIANFERSQRITENQYSAGVVSRADVLQARTQLESTRAQLLDLKISRAQFEHAIAVLVGKNPANFSVAAADFGTRIPQTPLGIPADLLERRPDIAAAERRVMAANAQIGVARAAYFPTLSLSGSLGYENSEFSKLIAAANRTWSVGPSLLLPIFRGGALRAATRQAIADYDASVAAYRQTTLSAFQDIEDSLVTLHLLSESQTVQDAATQAAREAANIAVNQYKAGTVSYLDVVVVQDTELNNARTSLQIRGRQLVASVALIRGLGGGWSMPTLAEVMSKPAAP